MGRGFTPIEIYKTKFYQSERSSNRFLNLSEEQLIELSKKVYKMQEIMTSNLSYSMEKISSLDKYIRTLQYLTNPLICFDLKTYDERLAYLIMMTDPNLITFKEFLKIDLISAFDIAKVSDDEERNRLKIIRNQKISEYETSVREKIGFYDVKLLKYEEMFFKKFFNDKELITEVGCHNQKMIVARARLLENFNNISDYRYLELVRVSQMWLSFVKEEYNFKVATYSVINQYKLLGLTSLEEQLALFILLVDSNLDMLKIYEEESVMKNIEKRIIEQFGYFNKELLILEGKFHARFCPEKQISIWTKTKKR